MEKVLITGIAGGQGRLLAQRLRENYEVCGVDRVGWDGAPRGVKVHVVDIRKKKFEDVIRTEMPTALVHLGFIRHFRPALSERYDTQRARHQAAARPLHPPRRAEGGGDLELVRLRRVSRESLLPGRGFAALGEPRLSRDPRSRRSRHDRVGLPVAVSAPAHVRAAARERARRLRALDDRAVPEAVADPDRDGLRPDDAVHPRRGSRPRRSRSRSSTASRVCST